MLGWHLAILIVYTSLSTGFNSLPVTRYDNYQLIEFTPDNPAQRLLFARLRDLGNGHIFLRTSPLEGAPWLVAVPPGKQHSFRRRMLRVRNHRIINTNLQSAIAVSGKQQKLVPQQFGWTSYQTLSSIYAWMRSTQLDNPHLVRPIVVGYSYENRTIRGVKLAYGETPQPGVFVECGTHAREWISPAFCTYLINQLLTSGDSSIRQLAESYDWYIVPTVNPDGYVHTRQDRLWRKTRSPPLTEGGSCRGADANRNWDIAWNQVGTSSDQCLESFGGACAFSEVETRTLAQYLEGLRGQLYAYFSFHAFSQLLMYSTGFGHRNVTNQPQLQAIGEAAAKALRRRYGTEYVVGPLSEVIYAASGSSLDYVYEKLGVPLAFAYELRPKTATNGSSGFELPAAQIVEVGEETLDSMVALLNTAKMLGYT